MIKLSTKDHGFTLIEVLIALMILAISLTAIVKATSSDIENTFYLKQKAIAHLVANEASQLIALKSIAFNGNTAEQETKMAGKAWFWQANKLATENKNIFEIEINVYLNKRSILTQKSYLLEMKK